MRLNEYKLLPCSSLGMIVDSEHSFVFGLNEGQTSTEPDADPI